MGNNFITVGARKSPLSQAQVWEVERALKQFHPQYSFEPLWLETTGDKDLTTSLKTLDKTDFFTKELDDLLLKGACTITIHSAKDLPEPLPEGLSLVALTQGLDPRDMILPRKGLTTLPKNPRIATSSTRREAQVKALYPDAVCVDVRGTINRRIELLDSDLYDALIIPECALIRLGITGRLRWPLPGEPTPLQGRLAVLARSDDTAMRGLFACLDS